MEKRAEKNIKIVYPDADAQILELFPTELVSRLKSLGEYQVFRGAPENSESYIKRIKDADAILLGWHIPKNVLEQCNKLKIISFTGISAENFIDIPFATSKGIVVTNTPGYGNRSVAEHTLGLILAVAKNITSHDSYIKNGIWSQTKPSIELYHKVVGIIGVGAIGEIVAKLCKALGMKVIAWTKHPNTERAKRLGLTFVPIEHLMSESDIISVHLPLNKETVGFIDKHKLKLIKRGAIFINTSRAELTDTSFLISLLNEGKIAGAGFDVFDQEPLPADHPLLKTKNVTLTPHIAFNTPEAIKRLLKIAVDNLMEYFSGNYQNIVNPEVLKKKET